MFFVVGHQVCTHLRRDFVPLLFADPLQVIKVSRLTFGNLNLQLPPQIFYLIKVWRLARPLHDLNVLLLEPLLCCLGRVFWVIVMMEYPSPTHFQCPGWFQCPGPDGTILVSSDHNTFTQSFRCSKAKFRRACTCAFLSRGTLRVLQDFSPSRRSVLPIVFLVTMVPAALRSLTRSSRAVLGWFLTVLMIIETPRGKILHGAPDRGRLTVILCFFHLRIIAPTVVTFSPSCLEWSCSPLQPCVGLQSCPWHPWTALWSWPWWRVWNLIDWLLLWTGVFYTDNKLRLGALPLRECS